MPRKDYSGHKPDSPTARRRLRFDDFTREAVIIAVDQSIGGEPVAEVPDRAGRHRAWLAAIVGDDGPEFTSRALDLWAYERGIELSFIRPGKPIDSAFDESFNDTLRQECLNEHWFPSQYAEQEGMPGSNQPEKEA